MPKPTDLSYYNWETQTSTSNSSPNFQVRTGTWGGRAGSGVCLRLIQVRAALLREAGDCGQRGRLAFQEQARQEGD